VQTRRRWKRGARHQGTIIASGRVAHKVNLADKLADDGVLNGQTFTAFGATSIDDCAATACFHTHAKAVSTLTAGNGRLVGTFHDERPNKERKKV
jgi:hypothetical protein